MGPWEAGQLGGEKPDEVQPGECRSCIWAGTTPSASTSWGDLEQLCREGPGAAGETQGDHEQTECPCGLEGQWDTGDIRKSMASRSGKDPAPLPCSGETHPKCCVQL